ncbi:hypothetical protein BDF21DRAFT_467106 [Thamnidium elegans]|uniref:DUF2470 domain-containing protein n=1 Tax=Thamnidium elegans TaxID=101142 RepID=A0A8H7STS6_9FUNG|nr:hypothetical protein INT48_005095 [Thamnidium elegans]KAI8061979.1 hypothetical protein BDF21DRAFT_467106 [Thamnidium elegans]
MATLPDPIAVASGPVSAYMSGHDSANLAYVKYFAKKTDAVNATFKSLNSKGFIVTYKTQDGGEHETFIEYNAPVQKREDLRPVLEDMAKEAEEALGMPSSLNGPPPFKAMMKAAEIEDAQKAEIERLQEDKDAEASAAIANAAIGNIFDSNDLDLDVFYPPDRFWQTSIAVGMGLTALLGYSSDAFLSKLLPSVVLQFRNYITQDVIVSIFKWACIAHLVEGFIALGICLKRKWYSPINVLKWTTSTILYATASMSKLLKHGKINDKKNN